MRYGLAAAERSTFDHVAPVCLANRRCHPHSHHHRLVLHLSLHHHHLDRSVVLCPPSSHLKSHMVRPPSPADAATARRFYTRHSNVTHDVHDTSPVGPSLGTTYCRTWVLLCMELFKTPSYVPCPSFSWNSHSASFPFVFYLAIGHGTTPLPLLAVAYLYITTLAGLGQVSDQSRTLSMQYTLSPSRSRVVAVSSSPYASLRFSSHAHGPLGARPHTHAPLPLLLSLACLLSLRDCEPASDLKHYPLNSHSVELFDKPDGLVNNAV